MPVQSHYEVLGINPQASPEEVERAYRFTLELYGDGALATYSLLDPAEVRRARARVQEAYEVLRDPARRHAYDLGHGFAITAARGRWPQPAPAPSPEPPAAAAATAVPAPAPPVAASLRAPVAVPTFGRTAHVLPEPITGAVLRRYREERGISLRDIANQSKIGTRYLEYIEGDRLDMLPAAVYLRGFLQEYARALGLDPRLTANAYMAQFPRPWPQE
jgi:flagellar biosynthesis protein FlhG